MFNVEITSKMAYTVDTTHVTTHVHVLRLQLINSLGLINVDT